MDDNGIAEDEQTRRKRGRMQWALLRESAGTGVTPIICANK